MGATPSKISPLYFPGINAWKVPVSSVARNHWTPWCSSPSWSCPSSHHAQWTSLPSRPRGHGIQADWERPGVGAALAIPDGQHAFIFSLLFKTRSYFLYTCKCVVRKKKKICSSGWWEWGKPTVKCTVIPSRIFLLCWCRWEIVAAVTHQFSCSQCQVWVSLYILRYP